jgi:hypothetical protein
MTRMIVIGLLLSVAAPLVAVAAVVRAAWAALWERLWAASASWWR